MSVRDRSKVGSKGSNNFARWCDLQVAKVVDDFEDDFADDCATNDSYYFHRAATDMELRSKDNIVLLEKYGQSVLGMNMSWMNYYQQCRPLYCDVTKPNSLLRQIITMAAQVGGLIPIALFLLRSLIWPLLAKLIGNK